MNSATNQPLRSSGRKSAQTPPPVGVHALACREHRLRIGARNWFCISIQLVRARLFQPTLKRNKFRAPQTGRYATHTLKRALQQKG